MSVGYKECKEISKYFSNTFFRKLPELRFKHDFYKRHQELFHYKEENIRNIYENYYNLLFDNFKNEYIYKNEIANKLYLEKHDYNEATLLTEFWTHKSKTDIVIINGTATVYEIKTEYDSLSRLDSQINDYRKVFDKIFIVSTEKYLKTIEKLYPDLGLIELVDGRLKTHREAKVVNNYLDAFQMLLSLKKKEMLHLLNLLGCNNIETTDIKFYEKCFMIIEQFRGIDIYKEYICILKERNNNKNQKDYIDILPRSLKIQGLTTYLNGNLKKEILDLFIAC